MREALIKLKEVYFDRKAKKPLRSGYGNLFRRCWSTDWDTTHRLAGWNADLAGGMVSFLCWFYWRHLSQIIGAGNAGEVRDWNGYYGSSDRENELCPENKKGEMMKIFFAVLSMLAVLIPAVAWAGEYFSQAEKQRICQTAARVLPGVKITYTNTSIGGAGILISPSPSRKNIFIHINAGDEIFIYQVPAEYDQAVWQILKTVYRIVDNRPASVALGR